MVAETARWKEVLELAGHKPRLEEDGKLWIDYDSLSWHLDVECLACHERWCIYCIDIEDSSDLIEPCSGS